MSQTATQIISTKMISVILGSSHPGGMFKSMCLGFVSPPFFFLHMYKHLDWQRKHLTIARVGDWT